MKLRTLKELSQVERVVEHIRKNNLFYTLDLETTSTDAWSGEIIGVGLSWDSSVAVYIPIKHSYDQPFDGNKAVEVLRPLLVDNRFGAFNAPFELDFLRHDWSIQPKVQPIDAAILSRVKGEYDLMSLQAVGEIECPHVGVMKYANFMADQGLSAKKNTIAECPVNAVGDYCGRDVLATFIIISKLYPKLKDDPIYKLEESVFPVVMKMRENGIMFDTQYFADEAVRLQGELDKLKKIIEFQISEVVGEPIELNIGSPKQLGEVLFDRMGISSDKETASGARSTAKDVLNKLKWKYPVVRNIISYKEISKRVTTYYNKYHTYVKSDGRIHSSYNQVGAPTGRFASSNPNLQNIPGWQEWHIIAPDGDYTISANPKIGFVVPKDCWMAEADYSQIEARMAAGVTQDPVLVNAFAEGIDFHTKTASLIYGVPVGGVTKEKRFMGKKLNFALAYGMGTGKLFYELQKDVDVTYDQAKMFREKYLKAYAAMFHVAETISMESGKRGFVKTVFGRKIPLKGAAPGVVTYGHGGSHEAYNYKIQGSAADLLKIALVKVDRMLTERYPEVKMILTTHDSISFEVPKSVDMVKFIYDVMFSMSFTKDGFPPFFAKVEVGDGWGTLKEMGKSEGMMEFVKRLNAVEKPVLASETVGKTLVLELPPNSTRTVDQVNRLKDMMKNEAGVNTLIMKVGEAEKVMPWKTGIDVEKREEILLLVGGKLYERL